jgi:large subunit ribosomal protein L18e
MKRVKNLELENLITDLKTLAIKEKVKFWKRIAKELEKPTRNRRIINVAKIDKVTKDGDKIIVPGKVLSVGELSHKVDVTALNFSKVAKEKINNKGNTTSIRELMKKNPKAKGIKIIA